MQMSTKHLPAPSRLTLGALVGAAAVFLHFPIVYYGHFVAPYVIIALIAVATAGLIASGWRWAPVIAALIGLLITAFAGTGIAASLGAVHEPPFISILAITLLGLVSLLAGVTAAIHNYRSAAPAVLSLTTKAGPAIAGAVVAMLLVATMAQAQWVTGVTPRAVGQLTTIRAEHATFDKTEIRVKAGQPVALNVYGADQMRHTFTIDELDVNVNLVSGRNNLVIFTPTEPGTYVFYCIPHYNKATGQGMAGKLIVDP